MTREELLAKLEQIDELATRLAQVEEKEPAPAGSEDPKKDKDYLDEVLGGIE